MDKFKTDQLKLELETDYDKLNNKAKSKVLRESTTLEVYPDMFSLLFNNKDAIKAQAKKDYYKHKYKK